MVLHVFDDYVYIFLHYSDSFCLFPVDFFRHLFGSVCHSKMMLPSVDVFSAHGNVAQVFDTFFFVSGSFLSVSNIFADLNVFSSLHMDLNKGIATFSSLLNVLSALLNVFDAHAPVFSTFIWAFELLSEHLHVFWCACAWFCSVPDVFLIETRCFCHLERFFPAPLILCGFIAFAKFFLIHLSN